MRSTQQKHEARPIWFRRSLFTRRLAWHCAALLVAGSVAAQQQVSAGTAQANPIATVKPATVVTAQQVFNDMDSLIQHYTQGKSSAYAISRSDGEADYSVVALYPLRDDAPDQGHLLLIRQKDAGYTVELAVPQQGLLARAVVDGIDVYPKQFLLHFSAFGRCGGVSTSYRFGLRTGNWTLTGIDQTSNDCDSNGEVVISAKLSKNLLTGKVIRQDYIDGKAQPEQISTEKFGVLLLRDFVPFDDRHGDLL